MTQLSASRFRLLPARQFRLVLLAIFVATLVVTFAILRGVAHAQTGVDPTVPLGTAVDTSLDMLKTDGPLWLAIVVAYVGLRQFLSRQHKLAQGRILATLTGLVGVGAAVIGWHFMGAPVGGIVTAIIAAVALIQHPTVTASPSKPAGFAAVPMMIVIALAGAAASGYALSGCGAAQKGGQALIDCTGGSAPGVVTNILSTLNEWNQAEADGGCRIASGWDFPCLEDKAVAKGEQIGGCALAEIVQDFLSPPTGRAAPGVDAGKLARSTLEDFRAKHARGAAFHFADGDR